MELGKRGVRLYYVQVNALLNFLSVGPYDLSGSMGLVSKPNPPDVVAQCDRILRSFIKHGKPAGIHVVSVDPEADIPLIHNGFRIIALGIDTLSLRCTAASMLESVRKDKKQL